MKYKTIYNYILTILANIKDPGLKASYVNYLSQMLNKMPSKIESEIDDIKKYPEKEYRFEIEEETNKLNLKLSYKEKFLLNISIKIQKY
jgi:hypothetical protein